VTSVRLSRGGGRPRELLRIPDHGYHVADAATIDQVATVLAAHAEALADLVEADESHLIEDAVERRPR
jgi:hypothetical protein